MDGTVKLFHLSNKRVLQTFVHCKPEAVSDAPADGSEMEAEEEELESTMSVECVGVARGNLKWLASGGMDKTLKIWDTTNGSCRSVCVHAGGVVSLRWHASLPVVCTGCLDNLVRLWDARSGNLLAELSGHRDQVTFIDCLPPIPSSGDELDTIVTASNDGTSRIFRVATLSLV
jgi:WD40 repeat protein